MILSTALLVPRVCTVVLHIVKQLSSDIYLQECTDTQLYYKTYFET